MKKLMPLALLLALPALAAPARQPDYSELIGRVGSEFVSTRTTAAQEIYGAGITDPSVYVAVAKSLESGLAKAGNPDLSKYDIDEIAWNAKALGGSGLSQYEPLLTRAANSGNRKISNHSRQALQMLKKTVAMGAPYLDRDRASANPARQFEFSESEHSNYAVGTSTLTGQAFLKQRGGGVVTCAGNGVLLMPDTPYFRELARIAGNPKSAASVLSEIKSHANYVKMTTCDANGNFKFSKLSPAKYIIGTSVRWTVGYESQGGDLGKEVEITDGDNETMLLDADRGFRP